MSKPSMTSVSLVTVQHDPASLPGSGDVTNLLRSALTATGSPDDADTDIRIEYGVVTQTEQTTFVEGEAVVLLPTQGSHPAGAAYVMYVTLDEGDAVVVRNPADRDEISRVPAGDRHRLVPLAYGKRLAVAHAETVERIADRIERTLDNLRAGAGDPLAALEMLAREVRDLH